MRGEEAMMGRTKVRVILAVLVLAITSSGCGGSADEDEESGGDEAGYIGLYLLLRNPSSSGGQCPASSGIEWDLGSPSPSSGSPGNPVSGASCSVQSSGAFRVSASGTDPAITAPNGRINIDFEGAGQSGGTFSASVYTMVTQSLETTTTPCTTSAVHLLEPGGLWIDLGCPILQDPDRPGVECEAVGRLVLTSCGE
jgi:hypothetical protein